MAYRFEIVRFPVIRDLDAGMIVYESRKAVSVYHGKIPAANEGGLRCVVGCLDFEKEKHDASKLRTTSTHGWCYQVKWIDKPRIKRFHNLYITVFAAE